MLKNNRPTALLLVIATVLSVATFFPGPTHKVLMAPKMVVQAHYLTQERQQQQLELQEQPSLDEWHITVRHRWDNDTVAGVRYGLQRSGRTIEEWTGKKYDQNEIRRLIRKAADHGNLGAKYATWNMDDSSKEGLLEISKYVITEDRSPETLVYLSEVMIWQASLTCDEDLYNRGIEVEHLGGDSIMQLDRYSFLSSVKQSYQKDCRS